MVKSILHFICILFSAPNLGFTQAATEIKCLELRFYYMNEMPKFDSVKTINLNENELEEFMYHNDTSLNLILVYKNYCNAPISISSKIILDQPDEAPFTI
jgi:hypothetical protein